MYILCVVNQNFADSYRWWTRWSNSVAWTLVFMCILLLHHRSWQWQWMTMKIVLWSRFTWHNSNRTLSTISRHLNICIWILSYYFEIHEKGAKKPKSVTQFTTHYWSCDCPSLNEEILENMFGIIWYAYQKLNRTKEKHCAWTLWCISYWCIPYIQQWHVCPIRFESTCTWCCFLWLIALRIQHRLCNANIVCKNLFRWKVLHTQNSFLVWLVRRVFFQ